jgi:hypothetical protein
MAFAQVKGIARDPKDYEVYKKEVIIEKEVPVEKIVEKVIEKEIVKEDPMLDHPRVKDALKHARRAGEL